jgi:centromere-localized protein 2
MPPTESTILSTFLLPPAPLPALISLKAFTDLFPRAHHSSPHIRSLYRALQHQRAQLADAVAHNIATETKRGTAQRRAVLRARRIPRDAPDDEVDIEHAVSSPPLEM